MTQKKLPPPGEIWREDFVAPLKRSALQGRVPVIRIADLVRERRALSPDIALRLERYFNTGPRFWMNLQAAAIGK